MNAAVNFARIEILEASSANGAMKRRFSGMHAHVSAQIDSLKKSFAALFTRERGFSRVHAHVRAQDGFLRDYFTAIGTFVSGFCRRNRGFGPAL